MTIPNENPTSIILSTLDAVTSATRQNLHVFRSWVENLEEILADDETEIRGRLSALVHVNQQLAARLSALSHEFSSIHSDYAAAKSDASPATVGDSEVAADLQKELSQ